MICVWRWRRQHEKKLIFILSEALLREFFNILVQVDYDNGGVENYGDGAKKNPALKLSFTEILDQRIYVQITKRLGDAFTSFPSLFQFFKLC